MDSNIRKLVHGATQDNDLSALSEAYKKLKKERQSSDDKLDAVSSDLFVLCAEAALKVCLLLSFIWLLSIRVSFFEIPMLKLRYDNLPLCLKDKHHALIKL